MLRKLSDSVVVITGASSGIGRAAAEAFADEGATVVLAARREAALRDVAHRCEAMGARALVVPTDVVDEQAVERLAQQALENFGRIDVWVNNAAVTLFARFEEAPSDVYRRVIETNLFGYIHGARYAMRAFREQGSGVLVNVSTVAALAPQPYTSAYVASKAAIDDLSDCLRMELFLDGSHDIHVCTILPASTDTPIFQQAANYTGRKVQAVEPVNPATLVADAIVDSVKKRRRQRIVGRMGRRIVMARRLAPSLYERVAARVIDRRHLQDTPADPTPGNLFEPMPRYARVSGGWLPEPSGSKVGTVVLTAAALAGAAALWWVARNGRDGATSRLHHGWNGLAEWFNGRLGSKVQEVSLTSD